MNRFCIIIGVLICTIITPIEGYCQNDSITKKSKPNLVFRVNYLHGSILNGTVSIPHSKSNIFECAVLLQSTGTRRWHQFYRYPQYGISLLYGSFGNDSLIGHTFGLYPCWYIETHKDKLLGATFKMGLGGAWTEKPYDKLTNPNNTLIGARISCLVSVGASLVIRPTKMININAGVGFLHCSNGHTYIPNGAIDNFSWGFGIAFKPNETKFEHKSYTREKHGFRLNTRLGLGFHEMAGSTFPAGGPKYKVYSLAISASHRIGDCGNARFGIIGTYYSSFYDMIRLEDYFKGNERISSCVFGPFVGHEYYIGRLSFISEAYANLYNPLYEELYLKQDDAKKFMLKRWFSMRIGFGYYVFHNPEYYSHQNLWLGLFIKTNAVQADYVDMTVGYVF